MIQSSQKLSFNLRTGFRVVGKALSWKKALNWKVFSRGVLSWKIDSKVEKSFEVEKLKMNSQTTALVGN